MKGYDMALGKKTRPLGPAVRAILNALETSYKPAHPDAEIESYRQNSAAIRIRIIDPAFSNVDRVSRDDQIWEILGRLPEDIQSQITVVLLLTPEEAKTSFANMDFENPIPSRL
jgi:stress-induced morphogen